MRRSHLKVVAATIAGSAIIAAAAVVTGSGQDTDDHSVASGSGDSATGTNYVQPTIPAMTLASTTTDAPVTVVDAASTALATTEASPTYKAAPPSGFAP